MNRSIFVVSSLLLAAVAGAQSGIPQWAGLGRTATHRSQAPVPFQNMNTVLWSMPVDLNPQYSGGALLIHYGSPLITHNNYLVMGVKTGATDGWRVEVRNGIDGTPLYQMATDYSVPASDWTAVFGPGLSPDGRLYVPAAGGTILKKDDPESPFGPTTRISFYGLNQYNADKANFDNNVKICTPLTVDPNGNIWFGFRTYGGTADKTKIGAPGLLSGVARIGANGFSMWRSVQSITGDANAAQVQFNCAPAVSADGTMVYVGIRRSVGGGFLVGLDSNTMALRAIRRLYDPTTGAEAIVTNQSSGAPMVGSDGDVYYGVLGNPHIQHNLRGWLLHFDRSLRTQKVSGSFGWDITPSIIPSSLIPAYRGNSPYLIVTKYNNYAGAGTGDGSNKVALLDPNSTEIDFISGTPVMRQVVSALGTTPDPGHTDQFPNAVTEWCINSAVVDYTTRTVAVNNEDGHVYKWDLLSGALINDVALAGPLGEAYTCTISGPTGIVYAINNGTLFAVGDLFAKRK